MKIHCSFFEICNILFFNEFHVIFVPLMAKRLDSVEVVHLLINIPLIILKECSIIMWNLCSISYIDLNKIEYGATYLEPVKKPIGIDYVLYIDTLLYIGRRINYGKK